MSKFFYSSRLKYLLAKEYLFFLKSIGISILIILLINSIIWSINNYRHFEELQKNII